MANEWTDDRVDILKGLWQCGHTARQIAEKLGGGVTRNAVIGKAHRMGLSSKPAPIKKQAPIQIISHERSCQWPIGHPVSNEFHFCGDNVEQGRPYCESHCALAYRRNSSNENAA